MQGIPSTAPGTRRKAEIRKFFAKKDSGAYPIAMGRDWRRRSLVCVSHAIAPAVRAGASLQRLSRLWRIVTPSSYDCARPFNNSAKITFYNRDIFATLGKAPESPKRAGPLLGQGRYNKAGRIRKSGIGARQSVQPLAVVQLVNRRRPYLAPPRKRALPSQVVRTLNSSFGVTPKGRFGEPKSRLAG